MADFTFVWAEADSLAIELGRPVKQASLEFAIPNVGPRFVTFWRSDKTGVRLYTEMHDVAERGEVGVLNFERVSAPQPDEKIVDVASAFQDQIIVSKLIIHESGTKAESGIVLTTLAGDEIIVVAGAYPYSLAVKGISPLQHVFEPEYPLDRYVRVLFT